MTPVPPPTDPNRDFLIEERDQILAILQANRDKIDTLTSRPAGGLITRTGREIYMAGSLTNANAELVQALVAITTTIRLFPAEPDQELHHP
jgi:hypothetical protein